MTNLAKDDIAYETFSALLRERFTPFAQSPLFTTDATGLFEAFLAYLPVAYRQHYTCNACRRFIDTFGGVVSISSTGKTESVLWQANVPALFANSVVAMLEIISKATVTGVLLHNSAIWGTPVTGVWSHLSVLNAPVYRNPVKTPFQAMAEKLEEYNILRRSLADYSVDAVKTALTLLEGDSLYGGIRTLGVAKWFSELQEKVNKPANRTRQDNLLWLAVATAPAGFCHVRNSMIGTLLGDIQAGMSFETVSARFADKMRPDQYQRAQVAPTIGNIQQAEKLVEKLGLENSLHRRYMRLNEIPTFLWRPQAAKVGAAQGGIFAGIAPKKKVSQSTGMALPTTTMTWRKFSETILPTATKVEVKVENTNRFAALVTAVHPDAPGILQWDNGVSWYYHGGADAEIRRRVESAGGRYEDNEIRCSLAWDNYTDLDLHCEGPGGHIYFASKRDRNGGWLDVDANGGMATTTSPVENIRWATARPGRYLFYIHNYAERARGHNAYKAELEVAGKIFTFEGIIGSTNSRIDLAHFVYQNGVTPAIDGSVATRGGTAWDLEIGEFYDVTGIVKSPNLWGNTPAQHAGDHTFFLIDGCKDTDQGKGRGFFNEMLNPELREIRKTLEAYTASTPIAGGESATACGLGYSKDGEWGLTLRVNRGGVVAEYKIDRWD